MKYLASSISPALTALILAAGLAACTQLPTTGAPREAVTQNLGAPTARYVLPEGGERLEYASGPFGRTTWMVDVGADGRVQRTTQVLNEANFAAFAEKAPGMPREQVLLNLGTPGEVKRVRYPAGTVWSYRYPTNDCLWFQVSMGDDGRAVNAGYGIDPRCDARSDARN